MSADDVEALNGLGVAYGDAARYDDAIRTFLRVLALDPTNGIAYQNLGVDHAAPGALDQGQRRPAIRASAGRSLCPQVRSTSDPALPDAHTTLGVILSTAGRKTEAIESWKQAVALDATQFNALYNLWSSLPQRAPDEEAIAYGRQFVATAPPAFFKPDIERVEQFLRPGRGQRTQEAPPSRSRPASTQV